MPSREYLEEEAAMSLEGITTPERLIEDMRNPDSRQTMLLDCRPPTQYHEGHVRGAINVTLPASVIMLRRLANGKLCIPSVIKDPESREKFNKMWKTHRIVLYDEHSEGVRTSGPCVMSTLYRRLLQDGCHVVCLQGGFSAFKNQMPEWCETDAVEGGDPPLSLENLRITPVAESDTEADRCDSGLDRDASPNDPPFPVEILPYLFLGNAENSSDLEALDRHKIRYILNVTPNLPNVFEKDRLGIKYMQIPIQDHWSQNLASFFPEAIAFIGNTERRSLQGQLV